MRKTSTSVFLRNQYLLKRIKAIKKDHPFWGYRRVWAYLRYIDGLIVNKKRIYRLMRENNLTVKPNTRLIAKRVSERPKPRANKPKQWWEKGEPNFLMIYMVYTRGNFTIVKIIKQLRKGKNTLTPQYRGIKVHYMVSKIYQSPCIATPLCAVITLQLPAHSTNAPMSSHSSGALFQ